MGYKHIDGYETPDIDADEFIGNKTPPNITALLVSVISFATNNNLVKDINTDTITTSNKPAWKLGPLYKIAYFIHYLYIALVLSYTAYLFISSTFYDMS